MGILIPMPIKTNELITSSVNIPAEGAKILLFTGVRYERYDDIPLTTQSVIIASRPRHRRRRA